MFSLYWSFLKGLFHPGCCARVISGLPFFVAIFVDHENGGNRTKRRHVQDILDERDPLIFGDLRVEFLMKKYV